MTGFPSPTRPLAIAHRAANDLARLKEAVASGADVVEADLWHYHGRTEVRHLKTMGPVPLLWDRWELVWGRRPRLILDDLLRALPPAVTVMLDLKGRDRRLPDTVLAGIKRLLPEHEVMVCSRNWALLESFRDAPGVRVVHSVGSAAQLRSFLLRPFRPEEEAISIHQRLLTPALVARLRERAGLVMSWPVNSLRDARRLAAWGVNGIITDELRVVRALARDPSAGRP
jgi:glycerophosphoryl diester phosphodiesterase